MSSLVKKEEVIRALLMSPRLQANMQEIVDAVNTLDLNAIESEMRSRVRVERWKGEKIAGVDLYNHPNPFLRDQYRYIIDSGGVIYKVYIDGNLVFLQYHHPFKGGLEPITEAEFEQVASRHVDVIVRHMTLTEASARAMRTIISRRAR
jgi:hypothetical protein